MRNCLGAIVAAVGIFNLPRVCDKFPLFLQKNGGHDDFINICDRLFLKSTYIQINILYQRRELSQMFVFYLYPTIFVYIPKKNVADLKIL